MFMRYFVVIFVLQHFRFLFYVVNLQHCENQSLKIWGTCIETSLPDFFFFENVEPCSGKIYAERIIRIYFDKKRKRNLLHWMECHILKAVLAGSFPNMQKYVITIWRNGLIWETLSSRVEKNCLVGKELFT